MLRNRVTRKCSYMFMRYDNTKLETITRVEHNM